MRELSHMIYNVADEDVQRAQNQLKASILFSQDGPSGAPQPRVSVCSCQRAACRHYLKPVWACECMCTVFV